MSLFAVVADASTADAVERARLAGVVEELAGDGLIPLGTCHRVEVYSLTELAVPGMKQLNGIKAVRRLLAGASGLERAVVGEQAVLHQVRVALQTAPDHGRVARGLDRLV